MPTFTTPEHQTRLSGPRVAEGTRRRLAMLRWSGGGLVLVAFVTALAQFAYADVEAFRIALETAWWCVVAWIPATLLVDRFVHNPATEGSIWIAFSTAIAFILLIAFFGVTHALYSRAIVVTAFVAETAWLILGVHLLVRGHVLRLGCCEPAVLQLLAASRGAIASPVTKIRAQLVASEDIDELVAFDGVVIDRYSHKSEALKRLISALKLGGVRIYSADHVHELLTGRLSLQQTEDSFLDDSSDKVIYGPIKRTLDVVGALGLLAVAGVPMLVIAAGIRLTSRGPALFRQSRIGTHGSHFMMLKFRTMDEADDARAAGADRVTSFGYWLRKFRLDELPQLINVLAGTMSLIGPRPEWTQTAGEFYEQFPHYPYRHLVRPGITGWAQVNQGHVTQLDDAKLKLEFDLYYVKHLSFALDLVIGARTLTTVLTGFGAK